MQVEELRVIMLQLMATDLVIAEVKREGNAPSAFIKLIKEEHIRPTGMSKYCIGSVLLDETIKYNNFKPHLLAINKLTNGVTA